MLAPSQDSTRARLRALAPAAICLAPMLVFFCGALFFPLYRLLVLSFSSPEGVFAAYGAILGSEVYRAVFLGTIRLALGVAVIATLLAYPTAYLLLRLRGWWLLLGIWCLMFPLWISVLVRTFSWMLLLERNGPVNRLLVGSGLTDEPARLLFNSFGVHLGMVHVLLPYVLLPIYTTMRSVDGRLLQASDSLGAGPLTTFFRVYLPLTLPGVAAGFLLVFLLGLGFYITPLLLGGPRNVTVPVLIDIFVNEQLNWPLAAAASFCLLFLIMGLLVVAGRFVSIGGALAAR